MTRIVEAVDVFEMAISACLRVSHVSRQIGSALIAAWQGIAQQCPEKGF
jgi:hypothetical protein